MSIEELTLQASEATQAQETAVKAFEAQRGTASIVDLGKLANAVTSATRKAESTAKDLANFALVGIYEGIKSAMSKASDKMLSGADIATLLDKQVSSLTITVPFSADGIDAEKIVVNTLGKRTVLRATGGNGTRARWHMVSASGETMECRAFLETHGDEAFGPDAKVTAQMVLDKPAAYGLSDYAARAGAKLTPTWERVKRDE